MKKLYAVLVINLCLSPCLYSQNKQNKIKTLVKELEPEQFYMEVPELAETSNPSPLFLPPEDDYKIIQDFNIVKEKLKGKVTFNFVSYSKEDEEIIYVKSFTLENGKKIILEETIPFEHYDPELTIIKLEGNSCRLNINISTGKAEPFGYEIITSENGLLRLIRSPYCNVSSHLLQQWDNEKKVFVTISSLYNIFESYYNPEYGCWKGNTLYLTDYRKIYIQIEFSNY